jgi:glycosyltransferase involved in cell wall biosynthesis
MKKQLIVLSQNAVFDLGSNAGKEVIYKTLVGLSKHYQIHLVAPGLDPQIEDCFFYPLKDAWFNRFKSLPFVGYLFNVIYVRYLHRSISKLVDKNKITPDLAYLAGPWMSQIGHALFKNKIPIVCRYFGVNWQPLKHQTLRQKLKFVFKNKGYRQFGDLVIMTNDGTRGDEFMTRLGCPSEKLRFFKNGVDFPTKNTEKQLAKQQLIKRWNIPQDHSILLSISRLAAWKKVERSLYSLSLVLKSNPNVSLIIVGDGEEKGKLNQLAMELGIDRNVVFTGAVKRDELNEYYAGSDIFLSLYNYSNAGNPLFEAMMNSCCIVTINSPSMLDFISNDSAVLLPHYEADRLANTLLDLLKNRERRIQLGLNARNEIHTNFQKWDERIHLEIEEIRKLNAD